MHTDSFTQQLVSMTGVEQQLLSNDLLQSLVEQSTSGSNLNALSLIGKTITAITDGGELKDGKISWEYELGKTAVSAAIEIKDAKGVVVWRGTAPNLTEGKHAFEWDGKNADGAPQPDGLYTIKITAKDAQDKLMPYATYFTGRATALEHENGGTQLRLGKVLANLNSITSVRDTAA
jgi:flagellar basal-body rod modification protein FlgD